MSGSKHVCCEHQVKTLHGKRENGPAKQPAAFACRASDSVAVYKE